MKKINGHNHFIENLFKPDIFKIIIKNLYETHYITSGMTKKKLVWTIVDQNENRLKNSNRKCEEKEEEELNDE